MVTLFSTCSALCMQLGVSFTASLSYFEIWAMPSARGFVLVLHTPPLDFAPNLVMSSLAVIRPESRAVWTQTSYSG